VEGKGYKYIFNLPDWPMKPQKKKNPEYLQFMPVFFFEFPLSYENVLKQDRQKNPHRTGSCSRDTIQQQFLLQNQG
jgi:hypothetical protein